MNLSELISSSSTRIKTGLLLLIGALIIGYIDSFFIMWLLLGSLLVISLHESMKLFKFESQQIFFYSGLIWFCAYFYPSPTDLIFVLAIVYASVLAYTKNLEKKLFLPLLYPTASFLFILALYTEYGMQSLLWLLVVVAGCDIGAYFVGRAIGKTKFCETSPNKTLEGVAGGVLVATLLGTIFAIDGLTLIGAIVISFVIAVVSIFGDLFESYLKREANLKDSGDILPGHGGILDRTDSYLFGAVILLIILRVVL